MIDKIRKKIKRKMRNIHFVYILIFLFVCFITAIEYNRYQQQKKSLLLFEQEHKKLQDELDSIKKENKKYEDFFREKKLFVFKSI